MLKLKLENNKFIAISLPEGEWLLGNISGGFQLSGNILTDVDSFYEDGSPILGNPIIQKETTCFTVIVSSLLETRTQIIIMFSEIDGTFRIIGKGSIRSDETKVLTWIESMINKEIIDWDLEEATSQLEEV